MFLDGMSRSRIVAPFVIPRACNTRRVVLGRSICSKESLEYCPESHRSRSSSRGSATRWLWTGAVVEIVISDASVWKSGEDLRTGRSPRNVGSWGPHNS
jgi:hypothetical protein